MLGGWTLRMRWLVCARIDGLAWPAARANILAYTMPGFATSLTRRCATWR